MTIQIQTPELESLILDRFSTGMFPTLEDALLDAMGPSRPVPFQPTKKDFAQFLLDSPLPGSGLRLERQGDYPEVLDL